MTTTNTNQSGVPSSTPTKVVPSEVGWQFVPQYYTFVNKLPHRLHCFYTKNSTFIHGTEGEDGKPCYGQQEIHNKILSIGFQDCKVFIHSVDAQSSANGGIIIQVIGEMSNHGDPWRKFAQTFFLAEQPNGYFVLNDIFRFLKEETAGDEESVEEGAEEPAQQDVSQPPNTSTYVGALVTPDAPPTPPPAPVEPAAAEPTPEPSAPAPIPEPTTSALSNGVHAEPEEAPAADPIAEPEEEQESTPPPASVAVSSRPATPAPAETPEPASQPAPAEPAPVPTPAPAPPAPTQAPVPTQAPAPRPPQPKTWANLAASNSNKWGAQVAQDAKGVSAAPPAPPSPAPIPPKSGSPAPRDRDGQHPAAAAAFAITTPQCFVKNVVENVAMGALRDTLTNRFGPVKELDIVRSKACAFLEFTTVESARRAIVASLPLAQGGEGGIKVGDDGTRITVELRKERGDRPPPRPRNIPPPNGDMRGGYRGGRGGGGGGRGRGIPK